MRLLLTSDLHFRLPWLEWLLAEAKSGKWGLIVLGGDQEDMFGPAGKQVTEWEDVYAEMKRLRIPLVACGGNHDRFTHGLHLASKPAVLIHAGDVSGLETVVIDARLIVTICPWNFGRWSALENVKTQRPDLPLQPHLQ